MYGKDFSWKGYDWECRMHGAQIHTGQQWQHYSEEQVSMSFDDRLVLRAIKDPKIIHHYDGKDYQSQYAVGTVRTAQTFEYGEFEAIIMFPMGYNLWPSFWLVGDEQWPQAGEIDVAECWSGNNKYSKLFIAQAPYICRSWRTTTNVHWFDEVHKSIGTRNITKCKQPLDPSMHFIKYSVKWLPNKITISANDKVVRDDTISALNIAKYWHEVHNTRPRMRVIFNLWVENPANCKDNISMITPMIVKDFAYTELDQ